MNSQYSSKIELLFQRIGDHGKFVLASLYNDAVTARTPSIVLLNHQFYFQTGSHFLKFKQIKCSPNVALCSDNIQITGIAIIEEHPFSPLQKEFITLFKQYFPHANQLYNRISEE